MLCELSVPDVPSDIHTFTMSVCTLEFLFAGWETSTTSLIDYFTISETRRIK
jgi:hypothetical protein